MAGESSIGSQTYFSSTTGKAPSVKPMKKLDKSVRRRGPFAMVGPSVTTKGGVQPSLLLSKEAKDEALCTIRARKRVGRKEFNVISTSDVKHHNHEHLDSMIKSALQNEEAKPRGPGSPSHNRLRAATNVSITTMKLKRDSMLHNVTMQKQVGREDTLKKLKGVDKLNFLMKGLDAKEGSNWKDLKEKVLTRTEKNDPRVISALKERTRKREVAMRRHLRAPSMLHHKEEEELDDEQWLKDTMRVFQRQLAHKDNRMQVHEDKSKKIKRMSKKNRKTILKFKQFVSAETQAANNYFSMLGGSGFQQDKGAIDNDEIARKIRKSYAPLGQGGGGRASPNEEGGGASRGGSPVQFTGF